MKIKNYFSFPFLFALVITAITSCKKSDTTDSDTTVASDCVNAENFFTDVKAIVDEAGLKSGAFDGILSDSTIIVSYDTINSSDADTITINFGINYLHCQDGRTRKGKIITMYNRQYTDTSKTHSISFNNFYVDNTMVNGTIKDSYKGYNATGHKYYADTINGALRYSNGKSVNWYSVNKIAFVTGDSTSLTNDDVVVVNGTAGGSSSEGDAFSMNMNVPLLRHLAPTCRRNLVSGALQMVVRDKPSRTADLGDGTCDDVITVLIDGNSYPAHTI